jgi:hypothetical protein
MKFSSILMSMGGLPPFVSSSRRINLMKPRAHLAILIGMALVSSAAFGQSLDIPVKGFGISFGNSKNFTGLRFNFRDRDVERITGVNVTFWSPIDKEPTSIITGVSFGPVVGGGTLTGVQYGLLGVAAHHSSTGLNVGGLGIGAGGNVVGVNIGGLGMGAGINVVGINIGGLGIGAGGSLVGITVAGLGAGAGGDITGFNIAGIGMGAGGRLAGINIAGIGAGAGDEVIGLTVAGIGFGAPEVRGFAAGGIAVGGKDLKGLFAAGGIVHVPLGGTFSGGAVSPFNYIRGAQSGISVGVVNYAHTVKGFQLGVVNIVRDNPSGLKVLPLFNTSF